MSKMNLTNRLTNSASINPILVGIVIKNAKEQAEKLKSRKIKEGWMKNDEGWRMNDEWWWWRLKDEWWWFQAVEGFLWLTDWRTDKRTFVNVELLSWLKIVIRYPKIKTDTTRAHFPNSWCNQPPTTTPPPHPHPYKDRVNIDVWLNWTAS